jgi:hypothetical protein
MSNVVVTRYGPRDPKGTGIRRRGGRALTIKQLAKLPPHELARRMTALEAYFQKRR